MNLSNSINITDAGLRTVLTLNRLIHLSLENGKIVNVCDFQNLTHLSLRGCNRIGDTTNLPSLHGLRSSICNMPKLQHFDLHGCTHVTDEDLGGLETLSQLQHLDLWLQVDHRLLPSKHPNAEAPRRQWELQSHGRYRRRTQRRGNFA